MATEEKIVLKVKKKDWIRQVLKNGTIIVRIEDNEKI